MSKHFKVWNTWRKKSLNNRFYKFLVLIKILHSPTMELEKLYFKENLL